MNDKALRLVMIGSGQISDRFFKQAKHLEHVEFVATSARHLERAEAKARAFGIAGWYDDYEAMIERERPDGVVVTTPHSAHTEPVLAALRRGIPVLVEKPFATRFEDARAMVDLARQQDTVLMALPFDDTPAFQVARRWLDERYLGKITGAEAQLSIPGPPRNNWYYDRTIAHGGAVFDCLPYPLSRLLTLLGPATSVVAAMNTLIPHRLLPAEGLVESTVDDNVSAILEFPGGQHALVRTLWGIAFAQNNTIIYGRHGTLALNDSGFPVVLHSPEKAPVGARQVVWRSLDHCYVPDELPPLPAENDILGRFVHAVRTGEPLRQGSDLHLHIMEVVTAVMAAAETGHRQTLTTRFAAKAPVDQMMDTRSGPI